MVNRTVDRNAVPVIYSVKTPIQLQPALFSNMRDLITDGRDTLPVDSQDGLAYMMKNH